MVCHVTNRLVVSFPKTIPCFDETGGVIAPNIYREWENLASKISLELSVFRLYMVRFLAKARDQLVPDKHFLELVQVTINNQIWTSFLGR